MSLPQHCANVHCFPLDHAASKLTAPSGNHISIPIRESDRLSKKARTRLKHTEYLTTSRRRTRDLASTLPSLAKYLRVTASPRTRYFCATKQHSYGGQTYAYSASASLLSRCLMGA